MFNNAETNRFYGGLDLPISNAIFVNGMMDPWTKVGLTSPGRYSSTIETILIEGKNIFDEINRDGFYFHREV